MKRLFRAEPGYLKLYNLTSGQSIPLAGQPLLLFERWLQTGAMEEVVLKLAEAGFIDVPMGEAEQEEFRRLIAACREVEAPRRALAAPEVMNIELTTRCPLRCPQCYCDLYRGRDIPREVALQYIEQAAHLKIPWINLSGGETLVYPYLQDLLAAIRDGGLHSAIAISGWGLDAAKLEELKTAGVDRIYVSLNGSTREVNARSRDGYELAIDALKLLQSDGQTEYSINWVARNDNVDDFPALIALAQDFGVKNIVILQSKPDAAYTLQSGLGREGFFKLAARLKQHRQADIHIGVEPCFSPLRAYIYHSYLWNRNTGVDKGCGAGRNAMSVDVEGKLTPCRHLLYPEPYATIEEYWWSSPVLQILRGFEDNREEPCRSCSFKHNCLSCRAVADKVEKNLESANRDCPLGGMEI